MGIGGTTLVSSLVDGGERLDARSDSLNRSNSVVGMRLIEGWMQDWARWEWHPGFPVFQPQPLTVGCIQRLKDESLTHTTNMCLLFVTNVPLLEIHTNSLIICILHKILSGWENNKA